MRRCRRVGVFQYRGLFEHSRLGLFEKSKKLKILKKNFKKRIKMAIFHLPQFEHESFWQ